MRDIFEDIFEGEPTDPVAAVRRSARVALRARFYKEVSLAQGEGGFGLLLDGRPVKTPARRALAAPCQALAEVLAAEWRAQVDHVDPARMPLTRLANTIVDGVADAAEPVAAEIANYLACDLVFYRASEPEGLVTRQAQAWNPLLAFAREEFGARFMLAEGLMFVAQPPAALAAVHAAIPREPSNATDIWRLGALHSITTLTGSALIALALLHGRLSPAAAWAAAHVDEDWNMEFWGRDTLALERQALRFHAFEAACAVLRLL
ncbi:MAG: hypothetical protein QOI12_5011 [Alphaproteobacteria bacterium]|jgi:chaperone required for assembly of F1-ATPase|nr:hypothetical protein [Alphaproteobacteria bacterium]